MPTGSERATLQGIAIQIVDLTNAERARAGLATLVREVDLENIGFQRSDDMAARHYFSHNDPVSGEAVIFPLADAAGYNGSVGENLGRSNVGLDDLPSAILRGWMNSAAHRANILDPTFAFIGVGVAWDDQSGVWLVTQVFAGQKR